MPKTRQPQKKMSPARYAKLIGHLVEGEYNCRELAEFTGLHYVTVLEYCRALHEAKIIYIVKWERDMLGRDAIKVYKFGPGMVDAPRRVLGRSEQQRRYRYRKLLRVQQAADEAAGIEREVPLAIPQRRSRNDYPF